MPGDVGLVDPLGAHRTVAAMFARRVRAVELTELIWELSPSVVFAEPSVRFGPSAGVEPFERFGDSVVVKLAPAAATQLCAEVAEAARFVHRDERLLLDRFASAVRSGLPAAPGMVRDGLCVLAAVRLTRGFGPEDRRTVQLAAAALQVASLGEIRAPRPAR